MMMFNLFLFSFFLGLVVVINSEMYGMGLMKEEKFKYEVKVDPDIVKEENSNRRALPTSYSIYTEYPNCDIYPPRNQGTCGCCWVFAVAQAMSDRICVAHEKLGGVTKFNYTDYNDFNVSTQSMVSCFREQMDSKITNPCAGGFVSEGIEMLYKTCKASSSSTYHCGSVNDQCWTYREISTPTTENPEACITGTTCPDNTGYSWTTNRIYAGGYRSPIEGPGTAMLNNIEAMKQEIYDHGPIIVGFVAYSDFQTGGCDGGAVYDPDVESGELGNHAVSVVGWGSDHWIIKNSWGTGFGSVHGKYGGYCKYKQGTTGIEGQPFAPEVILCSDGLCENADNAMDDECIGFNRCKCNEGWEGDTCGTEIDDDDDDPTFWDDLEDHFEENYLWYVIGVGSLLAVVCVVIVIILILVVVVGGGILVVGAVVTFVSGSLGALKLKLSGGEEDPKRTVRNLERSIDER